MVKLFINQIVMNPELGLPLMCLWLNVG